MAGALGGEANEAQTFGLFVAKLKPARRSPPLFVSHTDTHISDAGTDVAA